MITEITKCRHCGVPEFEHESAREMAEEFKFNNFPELGYENEKQWKNVIALSEGKFIEFLLKHGTTFEEIEKNHLRTLRCPRFESAPAQCMMQRNRDHA